MVRGPCPRERRALIITDLDEHGDVRIPEVHGGAGVQGGPETLLDIGGGKAVRTGAARPHRVAAAAARTRRRGPCPWRRSRRGRPRTRRPARNNWTRRRCGGAGSRKAGVRALDVETAPAGFEHDVDPFGVERIAQVGREPVLEARPRPARLGRELAGEPYEGPHGPGSEFVLRRHKEWQGGDLNPRPRAYESLALPG